jgi:hypothetical protein
MASSITERAQDQLPVPLVERLLVEPERRPGTFTARLERTGEVIVDNTRQPVVDAARSLIERGFDPATPLTMRVAGRAYDSFAPLPIGQWAKWTYTESEKHALKRQPWMPREVPVAVDREGQKSGFSRVPGVQCPAGPKFAPASHRSGAAP